MSLITSFFIHSYMYGQWPAETREIAQNIFMVLIITLNLSVFTICKPSAYRLYYFKKSTFEVKLNKAKYHHLNIQFHEFWQLYNIPESRYGIFPSPPKLPFSLYAANLTPSQFVASGSHLPMFYHYVFVSSRV